MKTKTIKTKLLLLPFLLLLFFQFTFHQVNAGICEASICIELNVPSTTISMSPGNILNVNFDANGSMNLSNECTISGLPISIDYHLQLIMDGGALGVFTLLDNDYSTSYFPSGSYWLNSVPFENITMPCNIQTGAYQVYARVTWQASNAHWGEYTINVSYGATGFSCPVDGGVPLDALLHDTYSQDDPAHPFPWFENSLPITVNYTNSSISSVSASPATINCGESSTLSVTGTAGLTYSWSPPADLSSSSGSSVIATPNTTTTYTVTGTDANSCTHSATTTVSVIPLPVVASTTNNTLCIGESATLNGSGATSYTWMPGSLTGDNVTVSPVVSTTYTVTGVSGACTNTATVPINIESISIGVSPSSVICTETVTLTAIGGTNCIWQPGSLTGNSVQVNPSLTTTYTLTATTPYGCIYTSTATITVINNCCSTNGQPDYIDYTAFGGTYTGQFSINGTFIVTGNVTFSGADVLLGTNAQILVKTGATLTIKNSSHLHACTNMWDGIHIAGASILGGSDYGILYINSSTIEDAQTAIYTISEGRFKIDHVIFDHNYKSIYVAGRNYFSSLDYPAITNSTFSCTAGTLLPPHLGDHSLAHIDIGLSNMSFQIGSPGNGNTFNLDVDYAIRAQSAPVGVSSNTFNFSGNTSAFGVYSYSVYYSYISGGVGVESNIFNGGNIGVYSQSNMSITVDGNTFNHPEAGISVENCGVNNSQYHYLNLTNNTITDAAAIGIMTYNNPFAYKNISNNTITFNTGIPTIGYGILAWEVAVNNCSASGTCYGAYNIYQNKINLAHRGLWLQFPSSAWVIRNTITVAQTASTEQAYGILAENVNKGSIIRENTVSECCVDPQATGIQVSAVNGNCYEVGCNLTMSLGSGLVFSGAMSPIYVFNNRMYYHNIALTVDHGAIGTQGQLPNIAYYNAWLGSPTSISLMTNYSNGNLSPFFVAGTLPYLPNWLTSYPSGSPPYATIPVTALHSANPAFSCDPFNPDYPHFSFDHDLALDIIKGRDYPVFNAQSNWIDEHNLYEYLLANDDFLKSDPAFGTFKTLCDHGNMGVLESVKNTVIKAVAGEVDPLASSEYSNAINALQALTPGNDIEANLITVYLILLSSPNKGFQFSDQDILTLKNIAGKCPYSNGEAVYMARTLLYKVDGLITIYPNNCDPEQRVAASKPKHFEPNIEQDPAGGVKVYPNPAQDEISVDCFSCKGEEIILYLYNALGQQVEAFKLKSKDQTTKISLSNYPSGIYLYEIFSDGKMMTRDKLVIMKK